MIQNAYLATTTSAAALNFSSETSDRDRDGKSGNVSSSDSESALKTKKSVENHTEGIHEIKTSQREYVPA